MKIKEIRLSEPSPTIKYCLPDYYDFLISQFKSAYNVDLPSARNMKFDNKTTWRVFSEPFQIWVIYEDGTIWDYSFDIGFITDLASVPSNLRSIIDNDMPSIIIGALIHDGYYQTKGASPDVTPSQAKREADDLLKDCCLYYGLSKPYAWAVHTAVEKAGGEAWNTFQERDNYKRFHIKKHLSNNVRVQ
jgi:hypothetical protein